MVVVRGQRMEAWTHALNLEILKLKQQNKQLKEYIEKEVIKGSNVHIDKRNHAKDFLNELDKGRGVLS